MTIRAFFAILIVAFAGLADTVALAQDNPSGLPLPRFASTRSSPINVRVGPGTRYAVSWVYMKPGTPVEIIQEFDTWRKIRDQDGSEGWIHQNLLSGNRAGFVAPWRSGEQLPLLSGKSREASVRAYLPAGFLVGVSECDGSWCAVRATDHPPEGNARTYNGFLPQEDLWGVYGSEVFD
jgi:SH3-like domain-containing protein